MKWTWTTPFAVALVPMAMSAQQMVTAPKFEVDPLWPRPMPNHWLLGSAVGLTIDSRDHVWVLNLTDSFVQRTETGGNSNPPVGECCFPSPNVLEFDPAGNLVGHWGGPGQGYTWPASNNGIAIAPNGNVWIGGTGPRDTQILEFTKDGKFVRSIGAAAPAATAAPTVQADTVYAGVSRGSATAAAGGRAGRGAGGRGRGGAVAPLAADNASTSTFGGPSGFSFDVKSNEAFVADGSRNHRIAVVDVATGTITRKWGGGGLPLDDAPHVVKDMTPIASSFANPVACAKLSNDGLLYVCDRANDVIQVFRQNGTFVHQVPVAPTTKGAGSVWDVAFSRDPQQKFLYVADGQNMKVHILDRQTLKELSTVGEGGRQPGEFFAVHSVATDSKGNLYTVESLEGKRLQKFVFKGVTRVPRNQGVTWTRGKTK